MNSAQPVWYIINVHFSLYYKLVSNKVNWPQLRSEISQIFFPYCLTDYSYIKSVADKKNNNNVNNH